MLFKVMCFSHNKDHWKTPPYWLCEGGEVGGVVVQSDVLLSQ